MSHKFSVGDAYLSLLAVSLEEGGIKLLEPRHFPEARGKPKVPNRPLSIIRCDLKCSRPRVFTLYWVRRYTLSARILSALGKGYSRLAIGLNLTMSTPSIKFVQNSVALLDSGNLQENPRMSAIVIDGLATGR